MGRRIHIQASGAARRAAPRAPAEARAVPLRPPRPPLSDGQVTLRPWTLDDVAALADACAEREIARWLDGIPQPYDARDARTYVELTASWWEGGQAGTFAVTVAESAPPVGSISVRIVEPRQSVGEVGYWLSAAARGRGLAARSLRLVSRWALEDVGLERLQLRADELNEPSRRVAERAGFRQEGILRSYRYNARQNRRVDFVMYSLLPGELP